MGENAGERKRTQAQTAGVAVITEQDFLELLSAGESGESGSKMAGGSKGNSQEKRFT